MSDPLSHMDGWKLIEALRGGVPATCDFCGKETSANNLTPEEAGDWVCFGCLDRWEKEEEADAQPPRDGEPQ